MLSYASERLKNDKELVYYAYKKNYSSFYYASTKIKNNKIFIEKYLNGSIIFQYLKNLKNDKEFVIKILEQSFYNIKHVGSILINDKKFIFELFRLDSFDCSIIKYFNNKLKNDKQLIMKCIEVQKNNILKNAKYYTPRLNLYDVGNDLQYDIDIIMECLRCDGSQLKNIAAICWQRIDDYQIANELILLGLKSNFTKIECWDEYEDILDYIDKSFRKNKSIVIAAIQRHGNNYHYASKQLKDDPEVIIEAINNCWYDTYEDDKYQPYRNEIGKSIRKIDEKIQKILESTDIRSEKISNAIINKLRRQYI